MRLGLFASRPLKWYLVRIAFWLTVNCLLGVVIALFQKSTHDLGSLLLGNLLNTNLIAGATEIVGYAAFLANPVASMRAQLARVVGSQLVTTSLAVAVCWVLWSHILPAQFPPAAAAGYVWFLLVASVLLTIMIGPPTLFVERQLAGGLADEKSAGSFGTHFSVRDSSGHHHVLEFSAVTHASAEGNRIVLHTTRREYVVRRTLESQLAELPADLFVRIHRKHVVNLQFLLRVEYDRGGGYRAYLADEEDTVLPVGRSFAAALKGRLSSALRD